MSRKSRRSKPATHAQAIDASKVKTPYQAALIFPGTFHVESIILALDVNCIQIGYWDCLHALKRAGARHKTLRSKGEGWFTWIDHPADRKAR